MTINDLICQVQRVPSEHHLAEAMELGITVPEYVDGNGTKVYLVEEGSRQLHLWKIDWDLTGFTFDSTKSGAIVARFSDARSAYIEGIKARRNELCSFITRVKG